MREVEDSPNRCPRCQRVQLDQHLCQACEHFYQTDNDILDLLAIMEQMNAVGSWPNGEQVNRMISTMREAIKRRNPYVSTSTERVCEANRGEDTSGPQAPGTDGSSGAE